MLIEEHFRAKEKSLRSSNLIDGCEIVKFLLNSGFYPEPYVFPPNFFANQFSLGKPFFPINKKANGRDELKGLERYEYGRISYPKTENVDITYGVYKPTIYHDIVYYLHENWQEIIDHLFKSDRQIYSYSFPIPIDNETNTVTKNRTERMIYEYIEAAEKDLVADGVNHKYVVLIDIKNFYPSIYTHSIAWALSKQKEKHPKNRKNGLNDNYPANIIDTLLRNANDGQTNGIGIGPVLSDLIAEIILSALDQIIKLPKDCFGIRFKDDYRIVCHTEAEAKEIFKIFKQNFDKYNLVINDQKSMVLTYPDGLFRDWIKQYDKISQSLKENGIFPFRKFKSLYGETLKIHKKYPTQGTIEKMLGEIIKIKDGKTKLKVTFNENNPKVTRDKKIFISYVWRLHLIRPKSLGMILGIIEYMYKDETREYIGFLINKRLNELSQSDDHARSNSFEYLWLQYFVKTNGIKTNSNDKSKMIYENIFRVNDGNWESFFNLKNGRKSSFVKKVNANFKKDNGSILENVALFQES